MNLLKYPIHFNNIGQTESGIERYVLFKCFDYQLRNKTSIDNIQVEENSLVQIALYLPNAFSEDLSQNWGAEQLLSAGALIGKAKDKLKQFTGGMVSNLGESKLGFIINPSEQLMYQGPNLRTFSFDYEFAPTSQKEHNQVKIIIASFKRFSLPKISKNKAFIEYPAIWKLHISGFDEAEIANIISYGINDIPLALVGLNLNYTPDGAFYAFKDGSPVKITVSMTFSEIEPLYRNGFIGEESEDEFESLKNSVLNIF